MYPYLYAVKNGQCELAGINFGNVPMSDIVIIASDSKHAKLLYSKYKADEIKPTTIEFGYNNTRRGGLFEVVVEGPLPENITLQ